MSRFTVSEAAELLGVSDDTVRRWGDAGRLEIRRGPDNRRYIDGEDLAGLASAVARSPEGRPVVGQSARNRLPGIVTKVTRDTVMAQVDIQAGPFRVVSLMSREAADQLGLDPGVAVVASVKSTNVVVELPGS
jgi:molybdopterin-binding protein